MWAQVQSETIRSYPSRFSVLPVEWTSFWTSTINRALARNAKASAVTVGMWLRWRSTRFPRAAVTKAAAKGRAGIITRRIGIAAMLDSRAPGFAMKEESLGKGFQSRGG